MNYPYIKKFKESSETPFTWYVMYCLNEKNTIKAIELIEQAALKDNWSNYLYGYLLPLENTLIHRKGQAKIVPKNRFSNYVYINVNLTPEIHHRLRNLKVKILGNKTIPSPVSEKEILKIINICEESILKPVIKTDLKLNDEVEITELNFEGKAGKIVEIDYDRNTAKVSISIFGKETPVEFSITKLLKKGSRNE